jgi:hypothetical protein
MSVRNPRWMLIPLVLTFLMGCTSTGGTVAAHVVGVTLQAATNQLEVGQSVTLHAVVTVQGSGAVNTSVSWSSTNPNVATVSSAGTVTASTAGSTTIRATSLADPSYSDSTTIEVVARGASVSWTRQLGTADQEVVSGIAVDRSGRTATIGSRWTPGGGGRGDHEFVSSFLWTHDANGSPGWGLTWLVGTFNAVAFDPTGHLILAGTSWLAKYANTTIVWSRDLEPSATTQGVAADSAGNVLVVGSTAGNLAGTNAGQADAFIRKYSSTGTVLWTRQFGTSEWDAGAAVAVDADDNAYVVGVTYGSLAGPAVDQGASFVRKYDSTGTPMWTRQFGYAAFATDVAVDAAGAVYVAGFAWGEIAPGKIVTGSEAGFIRKYHGSGTASWSHLIEDGPTQVRGVDVGPGGTVFIVGTTTGALGSGGNAGQADAFVRAISMTGSESWTHQFGTSEVDAADAVAAAANGDVIVAGVTLGDLAGSNAGRADGFVRRLAP